MKVNAIAISFNQAEFVERTILFVVKILNPRDTWERILRGPLFDRSLSS
jgi:hypothetical protein